jgi:hypothetical protein
MNSKVNIKWHYTYGLKIPLIMASGVLKTTSIYIEKNEKPALWFSTNQFWENTANPGFREDDGTIRDMSVEETAIRGSGLYRFGVKTEDAPYSWIDFKKISGASTKMINGLAKAADRVGSNPYEWFVRFEPLPIEQCIHIQFHDGEKWIVVTREQLSSIKIIYE